MENKDRNKPPRRPDGAARRDSADRGAPRDRPDRTGPSSSGRGGRSGSPRDSEADTAFDSPAANIPGLAPRRAAIDILALVAKGRTLDEALDSCRSFDALEGPDRGFARALATVVLRRRGSLDHILGNYLDRPIAKKSLRVMDILRLAGAQSVFMGTPPHATVSLAVSLAGQFQETQGYAGLINAIARKVAEHGRGMVESLPDRVDTPSWLWRAWERAYGPQRTRKIATANAVEAPIDLTLKDPSSLGEWAQKLGGQPIGNNSLRLAEARSISNMDGFSEGAWWVQDAAAALPVELFGEIAGKTVVDLCAAPGGKTMQLAARGAKVIAVDQSGHRLKRVLENLSRVQLEAETVRGDALTWVPEGACVDAILLDAPCTATGTIRRHPDILWSKTEDDLKGLAQIQADMLAHAVTYLKSGGTLVYCVCSLQREEGEKQIADFLKKHQNVRRLPITSDELGDMGKELPMAINPDGDLRTLPYMYNDRGGLDGFFAARLTKS